MRNLFTLLLVLAVSAQAGLLYLGYQRQAHQEATLAAQEQQIKELRSQLDEQQALVMTLQQESVGAMVKKANEVIVDGWVRLQARLRPSLKKRGRR